MANIMKTLSYSPSELQEDRDPSLVLIRALKDKEILSVNEVITTFIECDFDRPESLAKEVVWKLVEKGQAKFNDDWLLELT